MKNVIEKLHRIIIIIKEINCGLQKLNIYLIIYFYYTTYDT